MKFTDRWMLLVRNGMGQAAARAAARLDCLRSAQIGMVPIGVVDKTMHTALHLLHSKGAPYSVILHRANMLSAWPDTECQNLRLEYVPRTRDYHTNVHSGFYARVRIPCLDNPGTITAVTMVQTPFKTKVLMGPSVRVVGDVRALDDTTRWIRRTIYLAEL